MKINTPLITLLSGAAFGAVLLTASMLATPQAPAPATAAATPAPAPSVTPPSPTSPAPAATAVANVPTRVDYAGEDGVVLLGNPLHLLDALLRRKNEDIRPLIARR